MKNNRWYVANWDGDLAGHDMSEARAKALAAEMADQEPDDGWEAMEGGE